MHVKEAIKKGRSIRAYQDKEVPDEIINELIDAARLAPSGNNAQPWMFKIFKSEEDKQKLKEINMFKQDFVYAAPVLIVCCADTSAYSAGRKDPVLDDDNKMRAIRDLSIAAQNLILRATELGLGTCYVGWMNKDKMRKYLGLSEKFIVPYTITVGYPAENLGSRLRKNIGEIILK